MPTFDELIKQRLAEKASQAKMQVEPQVKPVTREDVIDESAPIADASSIDINDLIAKKLKPTQKAKAKKSKSDNRRFESTPMGPEDMFATPSFQSAKPKDYARLAKKLKPRNMPQTGGGILGALLGFSLGNVPGAVIGAGIGGAGGKGYEQTYDMLVKNKSIPMKDIYTQQGIAGIEEAGAELIGRGVGKGLNKLFNPMTSRAIPGATRLSEMMEESAKRMTKEELADLPLYSQKILRHGVFMTPAQLTESRGLDFFEKATESTIFGGNRIYQLKNVLQPKVYQKFAKEGVETFWDGIRRLPPNEVGQAFIDGVNGTLNAKKELGTLAYKHVDDMIKMSGKPSTVDMRLAKRMATRITRAAEPSKGAGSSSARMRIAEIVSSWSDEAATFNQAQSMRSDLLEEVYKQEAILGSKNAKIKRVAEQLSDAVDRSMEKTAKSISTDVYNEWRGANAIWKDRAKLIGNEWLRQISKTAEKYPHKVVNHLYQPYADKQIKLAHSILDNKTKQVLRASWVESLIKSTESPDGIVIGKRLSNRINDMGEDTIKLIFPDPEHLKIIKDIAKMGEILQSPTGGGAGMLAQLTQASAIRDAVVGLPTGESLSKESSLILLGPAIAGRIIASKTGAKWLSKGMFDSIAKGAVGRNIVSEIPPTVIRALRMAYQSKETERERRPNKLTTLSTEQPLYWKAKPWLPK